MGALAVAKGSWGRVSDLQTAPPRVEITLGVSVKLLAIIALIGLASFQLGKCSGERDRDKWWRNKIMNSSDAVRKAVEENQREIDREDERILKALEEIDAKMRDAEQKLEDARNRPAPVGCPRIPAYCLR